MRKTPSREGERWKGWPMGAGLKHEAWGLIGKGNVGGSGIRRKQRARKGGRGREDWLGRGQKVHIGIGKLPNKGGA